jgi:TM2 domain-containing membrane protein YozV
MISKDRAIAAMIVAVFLSGVGHMIVGYLKRGILILIAGFALGFVSGFVLPFPIPLFVAPPFWLWQIYDLYKLIHRDSLPRNNFQQGW